MTDRHHTDRTSARTSHCSAPIRAGGVQESKVCRRVRPLKVSASKRQQSLGARVLQILQGTDTCGNIRSKVVEKGLELNLLVPGTRDDDAARGIEGSHDALVKIGVLRRIATRLPTAGAVVQALQRRVRVHIDLRFFMADESENLGAAVIYPDNRMMGTVHVDLLQERRWTECMHALRSSLFGGPHSEFRRGNNAPARSRRMCDNEQTRRDRPPHSWKLVNIGPAHREDLIHE